MNIHNPNINHHNSTWVSEDVTKLISMTLDGCSTREIANALGTTRNAVIGKQTRLQSYGVLPKRPKHVAAPKPYVKKRGPPFDWTRARIETLKSMWAEGHTGASIARALGTSRDSVMGTIHRLGINRCLQDGSAPRRGVAKALPTLARPARAAINATIPGPGIPIEDRMGLTGRCKFGLWSINDYPPLESKLVCGQPSLPGESWCAHCYQIVYPPKIKRAA